MGGPTARGAARRGWAVSPLALLVAGAFFMEFLDGTVITTALPLMARSLGAAAVDLNVGVSAYMLTVAVFILPSGWAAERFGARRVFTAAVAVFTASSVLCGLSISAPGFVAARVLQGVGGAMMVPVGRLAVLRTTEKSDLMRAVAVLTWPALTAPLIGPPLGGFIAEHLSWRWIFFLNVPLGAAGILLALRLMPGLPPVADGARRAPFDWLGFTLGAGLCLCAAGAFELLGRVDAPWRNPAVLALLAAALGLALRHHVRRSAHPILDLAPVTVPTFRATVAAGTQMRVLISAMPFLLPLLFQLGFGLDPFRSGLLVLALFAGNVGIKPLTSPILRRWGFRTVMVANGLVQAATMLGCTLLTPGTPVPAILALLVASGASRSMQFTALGTLAFADVPQPLMTPANTLFSMAFQLALGLGVALGAVLLRAAGLVLGAGGAPALAEFRLAFTALALLTAAAALEGLRLRRDAGSNVSGRRG